jgi:uncharacterized NAD(P)/FAD-binding protein YdhS
MAMSSVAIVGGGASGTLTAIRLLADRRAGRRRIVLVERATSTGCGVAYRTTSPSHLLNVPASNMSAFPNDPSHFVTWASRVLPGTTGASFLPRHSYAEYLSRVLAQSQAASSPHATLQRVAGDVIDVTERRGDAIVELADGRHLEADAVVLA